MTKPVPSPAFGPVAASERIEILDILRGFALIGVLYVNMHNFGAWFFGGPVHDAAFRFMAVVFEEKFFSLFSFLFGIGFAIQIRRARARGTSFFRVYWRRLVVLFALGWVHALIYQGDIVRLYAILGFVLFVFRRLSSRTLILAATLIFLVNLTGWWLFRSGSVELRAPDPEVVMQETRSHIFEWDSHAEVDERQSRVRAFTTGSVAEVVTVNLRWWRRPVFSILVGHWAASLALFLLGLYTARRRILENIEGHRAFIRRVMWWGLAVGGTCTLAVNFLGNLFPKPLPAGMVGIRAFLASLGPPALMLFYASVIALIIRRQRWHRLFHPLAAVGRMALTVYVGQSVIYTTLYYGYGLGLWGRLGPAHILPLAAVIFAAEIVLCGWWIRRFRFGPLEWIWRSLTYGKLQPMRVRNIGIDSTTEEKELGK